MKYKKLTRNEFWKLTTIKKTDYGVFLQTQTDICEYGQVYKKDIPKKEFIKRYLDFYYDKLYLMDFKKTNE